MITADSKDIVWINDVYDWCLDSVLVKGSDVVSNVIKIISRNYNFKSDILEGFKNIVFHGKEYK